MRRKSTGSGMQSLLGCGRIKMFEKSSKSTPTKLETQASRLGRHPFIGSGIQRLSACGKTRALKARSKSRAAKDQSSIFGSER